MPKNRAILIAATLFAASGWCAAAAEPEGAAAILDAPVSRTVLTDDDRAVSPDDGLWGLYAEGRISEIRAALIERDDDAPEGLAEAVRTLHSTERLLNAASVGQWGLALSILGDSPEVLSCERADVIWTAAEAAYRMMGEEQGLEVMARNLIDGCLTDEEERRSAALMTSAFATADQITALRDRVADEALNGAFDEASARADARVIGRWAAAAPPPRFLRADDEAPAGAELRPIADPRIGEAASFPTIFTTAANPEAGVLAAADRLSARAADLPLEDLMSLAWFRYASGDPVRAAEAFRSARIGAADPAEALRGESLSYLAYEAYPEAEALLPEAGVSGWEKDPTYLLVASQLASHADRGEGDPLRRDGLTLNAAQAERIRNAALASGDGEIAQSLGWHSHRVAGCEPALPWWHAALKSAPDTEPAAFGLALCLPPNGAEAASVRAEWSPRSPRVASLFGDVEHTALALRPAPRPTGLNTDIVDSPHAPQSADLPRVIVAADLPAEAPPEAAAPARQRSAPARQARAAAPAPRADRCAAGVAAASLTPTDALARGWCMMEAGNNAEASAAFQRAMAGGASVRKDAAYGRSLLNLRAGDYRAADAELRSQPQSEERRNEIAASILSQQAVDELRSNPRVAVEALDKRAGYAEETPDLMVLRGWALHKAGRIGAAREVWREAEKLGSREAREALRDAN